jgi:hypothetical protein
LAGLAHLLAPLNVVLFTLGNDHVSVAELLGFVTGAATWRRVLRGGDVLVGRRPVAMTDGMPA